MADYSGDSSICPDLLRSYIFYRYLLAGLHFCFGENPLLLIWSQYLIMLLLMVGSYFTLKRIYDLKTAIIFIVLVAASNELFSFPKNLLDTTFNITFSFIALLCLINFHRTPNKSSILLSGLFLGLSIITRGNFLPFVPVAMCWILYCCQNQTLKQRLNAILLFSSFPLLLLLLVGVRNWLVADVFVVMPLSGGVNFWLAHRFNEFKDFSFGGPNMPDLSVIYKQTGEMILADPSGLLTRTWIKLLHLSGFNAFHEFSLNEKILTLNILSFIAVIYLWIKNVFRHEVLLLTLWVLMIWGGLLIIFPWGYGFRLQGSTLLPQCVLSAWMINDLINRVKKVKYNSLSNNPLSKSKRSHDS